jgi:hypothetical protein
MLAGGGEREERAGAEQLEEIAALALGEQAS